jgi:hypothetical protein
MKTFNNKEKLKEFISTKPALRKYLQRKKLDSARKIQNRTNNSDQGD